EGPDGYRIGWERLIDYFKTTFGEDKVIRNGQAPTDGAVGEDHIKKKSIIKGPIPAKPEKAADGEPYMRDAMPSWCGIFVFRSEGPDGYRIGWERLIDYFKTTFGEDKVIRNGQAPTDGAVGEDHIKKKSIIKGPIPAKPEKAADGEPYMRDAMPSWCGIFVF